MFVTPELLKLEIHGVMFLFFCMRKSSVAALFLMLLFYGTDLFAGWKWEFPFYSNDSGSSSPTKSSTTALPAAATSPPMQDDGSYPDKGAEGMSVPEPLSLQPVLPPDVSNDVTPVPDVSEQLPIKQPATHIKPSRLLARFTPASVYQGDSIVEDSHWSGQVLLDGWVTVAPQATLSIHPGTLIRVANGGGILVQGRLALQGVAENPIVLTSIYAESRPSDWQGIFFSGTDKNNTIDHVRIEGGETAISARFSSFSARNFSIRNSAVGIELRDSVASLRTGGFTGASVGIDVANSDLELDSVSFERLGTGIVATASAVMASDVLLKGSFSLGFSAEQSQLKIDRLSAVGNETGAKVKNCQGSITNSSFRDNRESGAILTSSRIKMTGNLFTGNRIGVQLDDNLPAVWGNAFHANKSYDLLYLGEENLFFGGNWFGASGSSEFERNLFSKHPGVIRLDPLLTSNPLITR